MSELLGHKNDKQDAHIDEKSLKTIDIKPDAAKEKSMCDGTTQTVDVSEPN